jgi:hypothetical protein
VGGGTAVKCAVFPKGLRGRPPISQTPRETGMPAQSYAVSLELVKKL